MPSDPKIRASDADRDRTAALLREHLAAGRLTAEEYHERLDLAYEAKTLGQLDELMADLPGIDLYELPDAKLRRAGPAMCRSRGSTPGSSHGGVGFGGWALGNFPALGLVRNVKRGRVDSAAARELPCAGFCRSPREC